MKTYSYSLFAKFWYRYANILITILLLFYTLSSVIIAFQKWYFALIALFNVLLIFMINRFYLTSYRRFPFRIKSDTEGIICENFFLSKKKIRINFEDIDSISGGMFAGFQTRPVFLHDSKQKTTIGFFAQGEFRELLKVVLKNINEDLYKELLEKLKGVNGLK